MMRKLIDNTRRPDISFHRNGRIRINARIVRALAIKPGDAINIAVSNGEYLLYAIHLPQHAGRHEAQCRPTNRGGHNYCAFSVRLCAALFEACGISNRRASFMTGEPITTENDTYIPIITRRPL